MRKEYIILAMAWIIMISLLVKFIPKNKIREAQVAFLFKQVITWIIGLSVVQVGLLEYPYRLFPHASKTSFTFEYFIYPAICAIFQVHYPEKQSTFKQFMYYFYYCTGLTIIEVIIEKYTELITYVYWNWSVTWVTLFLTFYTTRKYYQWFFKSKT